MATFRQIIYAINDLLKLSSDDAFYTEEHILFLASKMRALLLERKYKQTRNSSFTPMNPQNLQQICLDMEPTDMLPSGCAGGWLKSVQKIPALLGENFTAYPISSMLHTNVCFISEERMPFVGHNKWLKNIIYCSRGKDGYLYAHGMNPQFMLLEKMKAEGVFADPEEAAALSCDPEGSGNACEPLENEFPLEEAMVPALIEMVVQELNGSRFAPKDKYNNAHDELSDAGMNPRSPRPARNEERAQAKEREEAD